MTSIGSFEAKRNLSQLLRRVEGGEEFVITRHGTPVAQLVPIPGKRDRDRTKQIIAQIKSLRAGRQCVGRDEMREMIEEGRQ